MKRGLLFFANLLEVAHLSAQAGRDYEAQEELVSLCRESKRPFLASMPLRHRFTCPTCGVQRGEVALHFEDPGRSLSEPRSAGLFGVPAGQSFDVELSDLHGMLVHEKPIPQALHDLLAGRGG